MDSRMNQNVVYVCSGLFEAWLKFVWGFELNLIVHI
jgi:hypothetical protein